MEDGQISHFCVLDFECAWDTPPIPRVEEIIEFPSVLLRASDGTVIAEIEQFVQTKILKRIHPETTQITGISAQQVVDGKTFFEAMSDHKKWLEKHGMVNQAGEKIGNWAMLHCGDFDGKMIVKQAKREGVDVYPYFEEWVNIKVVFQKWWGLKKQTGMAGMLKKMKMNLVGRHHSGIDDCRNLSRLTMQMLEKGCVISITHHAK